MKLFVCPVCQERVYFENTACPRGHALHFDPGLQVMTTGGAACANREAIDCNWIAETGTGEAGAGGAGGLCRSCAMTRTVPDTGAPENAALWARTEAAKRRMIANLARWGWFAPADAGARPVFELLSERTATGGARITMGHADGLITINVTEASEAVRARRQEELGELHRTMIGHMRHEMAHFLHIRLSEIDGFPAAFRALFGDERADYGEALARHYDHPRDPGEDHITSYATAHPHEDWAETTAHLLHLVDLIDSVASAGLALPGGAPPGYDAYAEEDPKRLIALAVEAAIAVNHVNRALELADLYPFVLTPPVRGKLAFVHRWLREGGSRTDGA